MEVGVWDGNNLLTISLTLILVKQNLNIFSDFLFRKWYIVFLPLFWFQILICWCKKMTNNMRHGWNVWQCILMRCNMGQNQMNSISALGKPILLGLSAGDKLLTSFTSTFNIIGQCISISIIMQIMNHDCLHKIHLMTTIEHYQRRGEGVRTWFAEKGSD